MSKYDDVNIQTLFGILGYMEACAAVYTDMQAKIKYHVEKGVLTDSEVAPMVEKSTKAYVAIDEETVKIEKALEIKIRKISGLRDLTTTSVRMNREFEDLINKRNLDKLKDGSKDNLKIEYD